MPFAVACGLPLNDLARSMLKYEQYCVNRTVQIDTYSGNQFLALRLKISRFVTLNGRVRDERVDGGRASMQLSICH